MSEQIKNNQWIYVLVHGSEGNEQLLGQQDMEMDLSFIPIFIEKEHALMNLNLLARDKDLKYEVQAMLYEDIVDRISGQDFMLFVLDEAGKVIRRIKP